jgi:hypothetical protein
MVSRQHCDAHPMCVIPALGWLSGLNGQGLTIVKMPAFVAPVSMQSMGRRS